MRRCEWAEFGSALRHCLRVDWADSISPVKTGWGEEEGGGRREEREEEGGEGGGGGEGRRRRKEEEGK